MNDVNLREPIPLAPPTVLLADPVDGLIKTADLESPIAVQVRVWEAAEPGYYFQLTLDGIRVGGITTITANDKVGDLIAIELNHQLLGAHGCYRLGYLATSPLADSHVLSLEAPLKVDRRAPGATLLAPVIFSDEMISGQAIGRIPGYFDMELGDTIQTVCNGSLGPAYKVQADDFTVRPIEVTFAKDFLESLGSESVLITYTVTDRAGNVSVMSETTHVTVIA